MNILILGGNSDIGLAIAEEFAKHEEANIILASRNQEELKRNAADLSIRYNIKVQTSYFDACDLASHQKFYITLPFKPDGVILAFGYNGNQQIAENDPAELRQIIDTNYTGAASILEIIAADFKHRNESDSMPPFIIGLSSVAGERGRKKNYIYGSSKAGLTTLFSGLRQRFYKSKIRVITIKLGFVDTKMTKEMDLPGLLILTPEKVAKKTYKAFKSGKTITHITWYWWGISSIIKMLPERIFKRLNV